MKNRGLLERSYHSMFYTIEGKTIKETTKENLTPDKQTIGFLEVEELQEYASYLGFDEFILSEFIADVSHLRTSYEVYDEYCIAMINVVSLNDITCSQDTIAFILKKNQFFVIKIKDDNSSTMEALQNAIKRFKQNASLEKIIFGTLDMLLANGNHNLEKYEKRIMKMEQELVSRKIGSDFNKEIYEMRRQLSQLKNYYQRLVDIGESLLENENEVFEKDGLRYIKIFTDKAQRLSNNAQALGESLIHIREALDAALNYSMNKIMKIFTVVSVIFMPLTLIVGWYGMNFKYMPEIGWRYGYVGVIVLSAMVLGTCLIYFKKKKWL